MDGPGINTAAVRAADVLRNIAQRKFLWDTSKVLLGSGLGQLVTFIAAPIIARVYGPESFGEQSTVLSIVGPMATLTTMAFPIAIVVAEHDREATALARLALLGSVIFAPIATLALLINDKWLLKYFGLEQIGQYVALVPALVILMTINMSSGYIMTRHAAFTLSAKASVATAVVGSCAKLMLGLVSPSTISLIAGNALGYIVTPVMALRLRRRLALGEPPLTLSDLGAVAAKHSDFPLLRAPQNFIAAISQALPIVGLTAAFSAAEAGQYAIAVALAGAPVTILGNAVQSVLYPRITLAVRSGEDVPRLLLLSTLGLVAVGLPFFLPIAAFGALLFDMLLGPEWQMAGLYSALITPWLWLGLANRPAVSVIPALGLQRGLLFYEILSTAAKVAAISFGIFHFDSAIWTVGLYSIVGAFSYAILIVWVFLESRDGSLEGRGGKAG